jgi:hypothetical protein
MTITIKKRGYWCLRIIYTLCQGLESDGRNFLAAIVRVFNMQIRKNSKKNRFIKLKSTRHLQALLLAAVVLQI